MNIRDLSYLVALDDHRHFGKAAEAVHTSQPTISTQLKRLEDELGVVLIERNRRQMLLTPVGAAIVERARVILDQAEQIKRIAHRTRDPDAGSLRLGLFPTLAPYLLPHVLGRLKLLYPRLQLLLTEDKTEALLRQLAGGALDAALLALPVQESGLECMALFDEPFMLAVPAQHALANAAEINLELLGGEELMLLDEGHCLRDQALDLCRMAGSQERNEFRASSLETLRYLVAAGVGSTLLPMLATVPPVVNLPGLVVRSFARPAPQRTIGLCWRRSSSMDGFLRSFGQALAAEVPQLLVST